MSQFSALPAWAGNTASVVVPRPSWLAPAPSPSRQEDVDAPGPEDSLLPENGAHLHAALAYLPEPPLPIAPELPAPPAYPDLREECGGLRAQLAAALDAMANLRRSVLEASEPQLVRLACAVGERVAGRELQTDPTLVVAWAREAIDQLVKEQPLVIAVSSDIAASLGEAAWAPLQAASVTVETDKSLAPASCEIRGAAASVDASLTGRADAVFRAIGGLAR
jgi:hypothetical protein